MEFFPLRGDCNIHRSIRLADGIFPTRTPCWWEFPHSKPVTTSIHPSTCPADGISPTRRRKCNSSTAGIFPTWRIVSVHSADGISPTRKCQCRFVYELFSVVLWEPKSSVMGLPLLGISHYVERFSPLRASIKCSVNGIAPSQSTYTSLQAPII